MTIPVGTLCFVVNVSPGNERLRGRIVTVTEPLRAIPERAGALMYRIDADWLRSELPKHRCYAAPAQLRPITPPPALLGQGTLEPVSA